MNTASGVYSSIDLGVVSTLTYYLQQNRTNEFMQFLIILSDEHYKKGVFIKSYYERIKEQEFPGELTILNKKDLAKDEYKGLYIMEGNVMIKKLYIKLPKENLYVDAGTYEEKLLDSITNEFLRILATLNAHHVKLKIYNENDNNFKFNLNTSVIVKGFKVGAGGNHEQSSSNATKYDWELTFSNSTDSIDINIFVNPVHFYYLPKHTEWSDVIRNRLELGQDNATHIYEHTDSNDIRMDFISKLHMLNIECNYQKHKYEKLRFEYSIKYHPISKNNNSCSIQ